MPKETWTIAGILTIALLLALLVFSSYDKKVRLEQAQAELAQTRQELSKSTAESATLKDQLGASNEQVHQLEQEKEAAVQKHQSLESEMREALESKDVTISRLQGKLTVNILDRVLFDSGEAELKPDGEAVLRKVAALLQQHTNLQVHVVGHTDNVPIRAGRSRFASNWELSTARATAAVRFLTEKGGVDPRRLGALGYGEFRPLADNGTAEGRAKNRRIAVTILSEEMAGADVAAAANRPGDSVPQSPATIKPSASPDTNLPPANAEAAAH
jgi:chemotaxis protein MotB